MVHHGKHIIDPETGLCEICDKDAIEEVYRGKRPGKQVFYSNHDDRSTYRSNDDLPYTRDRDVYEMNDEPRPRYTRRSMYPPPTVRPRRAIYEQPVEEPIVIRRKVIRRDHTPPEDVIIRRPPPPRPTTFYHVDEEGQMVSQNNTPPPEPPRRYVVQGKQIPPARTVRVVRRQTQTPPPPASEIRHPRRQINSDTVVVERQQEMRRNDSNHHRPLRKPEMYYIEAVSNHNRHPRADSPMYVSRDNITPPPKVVYQGNRNRKPNRIEPMEQNDYNQPEPTVVRRVYKKLPPGKFEPPNDEFIPNENHPRSIRRNERNPPPPRQYRSSPQLKTRSHEPAKNPSIYYIRPVDEYE